MKTVKATIAGTPYRTVVSAGTHVWVADEPEEFGGADAGASPTELLLSALASCTLITCRMYAGRKGWRLEAADAEVSYDRTEPGPVIRVTLQFKGPLSAEQTARLLDIAGKCPVHRLLQSRPEIRIASADDGTAPVAGQ